MELVPLFNEQQLEAIARALGDTDDGISGTQIGHLLKQCQIPDSDPGLTKWKRLYNAFVNYQNQRQFGNHVVLFITKAMNPVQFSNDVQKFCRWQERLNAALLFTGLFVGDDGKVRKVKPATNLDEAKARASRLESILKGRSVHPEVLKFCNAELLKNNYFHAVFEATKSIAAKIRSLTGHPGDGAALVQAAIGGQSPLIALNDLRTESDKSEQAGFLNLITGLFGAVRNPLAHNPKVDWVINEQDALDILTFISLIHRKIDQRKRP